MTENKRLTTRSENGAAVYLHPTPEPEGWKANRHAVLEKCCSYEDAEEQGLLLKLPVAIGSDIYFVPSKVNYALNKLHHHEELNRVYHQKVARITFNKYGWYIECDKNIEYGVEQIFVEKTYKVIWFTSNDEAEKALEELRGGDNEV